MLIPKLSYGGSGVPDMVEANPQLVVGDRIKLLYDFFTEATWTSQTHKQDTAWFTVSQVCMNTLVTPWTISVTVETDDEQFIKRCHRNTIISDESFLIERVMERM